MTFLHSIALFGLFATALPLIIHLFSRRKKARIPFSSLYFLKLIESRKIRRLKVKQLILLMMRMAVVALLVTAFARPALVGDTSSTYPADTPVSAVIIVDNTLSTGVEMNGAPLYSRIRRAALQTLDALKEGDEIHLLFTAGTRDETALKQTDKETVRRLIGSSVYTPAAANLVKSLEIAYAFLEKNTHFYREIYLISDFQATGFPGDAANLAGENGNGVPAGPAAPIRVFCIDAARGKAGNIGITGTRVVNQILEQEKQFTLRASVGNFSPQPADNEIVSVYMDGVRVAQKNISLDAGGTESVDFQLVSEKAGIIEGAVEIADDRLQDDNRRYFVVNIPEKISLLIVNGDEQAGTFLQPVFAPEVSPRFSVHTVTEQRLAGIDLKTFDVVIYGGFTRMTEADIYRLSIFCAAGGGVVIFPGDQSDLASFNQSIGEAFGLPRAVRFSGSLIPEGWSEPAAASLDYLSIQSIDFSHPVFFNMFREEHPELNLPRIYRSVDFSAPGKGSRGAPATRTIMTLSNGKPFLSETAVGRGAVVLFASAPSMRWTTFPVKGLFPPLMHRMVSYLSRVDGFDGGGTRVGGPVSFLYNGQGEDFSITSPAGEPRKLSPQVSPEGFRITFTETETPGIYTFTAGNTVRRKFAVNIDPDESDVRHVTADRLEALFGERPYYLVSNDDPIADRIHSARSGREIGRYLLITVLVFLFAEIILQHEKGEPSRQEEFKELRKRAVQDSA